MRAFIYNQIKAAVRDIAEIRHTDLFNEQLLYAEEEQPFDTPAVLVEFADIEWRHELRGVREAVVTVRLHVVTDTREGRWGDCVNRLLLCDGINRRLHGAHAVGEDGSVMDGLTLYRSVTDHRFGELADDVEEYRCHVTDTSAAARTAVRIGGVEPSVGIVKL